MSSSSNLIVQDYLSSLKEDRELDLLFPKLLSVMGYRVVQTAKESKGQPQYGKDIIAIGKDVNGVKYRWYFELKGYSDKDITNKNYFKSDGIRESIIEAKDTVFNDLSIPEFSHLPIKIVIVHNGTLKANLRPTFDGFISREFEQGQFERWDIYYLTQLFSKYLFDEYLLSDEESNRLLKRALVFLDSPDNDYSHFRDLVAIQFEKNSKKGRSLKKLFATLNLLNSLVYRYSLENEFLTPALECTKILIISTWNWILTKNLTKRKAVKEEFNKLLKGQYAVLIKYFKKTIKVARIRNGLYAENGVMFESVGYPIRCFKYVDDLIYFYRLRNYIHPPINLNKVIDRQKDSIVKIITNNSGFFRPIFDNHSIPILQIFIFFLKEGTLRRKDVNFVGHYIRHVIEGIEVQKIKRGFIPDVSNNYDQVIEAFATGEQSEDYGKSTSILLAIFLELSVVFNSKELFEEVLSIVEPRMSLQIPLIDFEGDLFSEEMIFQRNLNNIYFVECIEREENGIGYLKDNPDFEKFKEVLSAKKSGSFDFITDASGYYFVRLMAHSYFKNEILPDEWRELLKKE